ncbi:MAG: hypothetical protein AB3N33_11640 [Puniceicoccaceae bacterium]
MCKIKSGWAGLFLLAGASCLVGQEESANVIEMSAFPVFAGSFAEQRDPAVQLSDRMAREVRVDLQTRGGNRYQTDISIRGGIFEGTGLTVGGLALFDPQTGHYFSEIPLDPAFFGGAYLLTGTRNGLQGFNSTVGSIDWQWAAIEESGSAYGRIGTDSYFGGGLRQGGKLGQATYEVALTHETGDGSIPFGDFDLTRISGRLELGLGGGTLRLFGGYLDKFYGWPEMYIGGAFAPASFNETDDYSVYLLGWQWESTASEQGSRHRIGGYWREVDDDYEFNRNSPNAFFEHKTEVYSLQGDGTIALEQLDLLYRWVFVEDTIIRSTSLVHGDFSKRNYGKAAVLARRTWEAGAVDWSLHGGMAMDTSSEDSTIGLPQVGVSASGISDNTSWKAYLEYSQTSQVPGYTVLNSRSSGGLFRGDSTLGRELADTIEAGVSFQKDALSGKLVLFHRDDSNLVDWVYAEESSSARQAAAVDIEVTGVEGWLRWEADSTALEIGYAWLGKDEDYGDSEVDASFYALNYARHRLLASLEQQVGDSIILRLEGEYRDHPDNSLRTSDDTAFLLHMEAAWQDAFADGWDLVLRGNNLTEEDFQMLPGTPGPGREVYLTLRCGW